MKLIRLYARRLPFAAALAEVYVAVDVAPVPEARVLDRSTLGCMIDVYDPESLIEAAYPLKIVEKAPHEVTVDGNAFAAHLIDLLDVAGQVINPSRVVDGSVGRYVV